MTRPIGLLVALLLTACATVDEPLLPPEPTLATLSPAVLAPAEKTLPQPDLDELAATYRQVLQYSSEPGIRLQVQQRLADIALRQGEARLGDGGSATDQQIFAEATRAYEQLLSEHPDNPEGDDLLYQASRAYALSGASDRSRDALTRLIAQYPASPHVPEAYFRQGEWYFAQADYARAEQAYGRVTDFGSASPYYTNAQYMRGWSQFKLGDYQLAIAPLSSALDKLLPTGTDLATLPPGERELAQDTVRVLALIFSYLEGPATIEQAYAQRRARPYEPLLYRELGDLYLKQERFRDSAQAYRAYILRYPEAAAAPSFQERVIAAFAAGRFPQLVVAEKANYVESFGVGQRYWQHSNEAAREAVRVHLQQYIQELASYYHALAQHTAAEGDAARAADQYHSAAGYYQQYIDSFPQDAQVPEMAFLLGESRFESGDYQAAVDAYEWVAYEFSSHARAADAGYAALLAYQKHVAANDPAVIRRRVKSELRFATTFDSDPRAVQVRANAAQTLLKLADYNGAVEAAGPLVTEAATARLPVTVTGPAWLVTAHAYFALENFKQAERAYRGALAGMTSADDRYRATIDSLAASIYKQAEAVAADGEFLSAAQMYARVLSDAPMSKISVNAQYDAAQNYMQAQEWAKANALLLDFRRRYPAHELTASIPAGLISNYEHLQQWQHAAVELDRIADVRPAGEAQRQALYLAAQYYDRAGAGAMALMRYRSYAHTWEQPVAVRMEAMSRLAQMYQVAHAAQKRRYWLRKIIAAHDGAGTAQTERTLYLAANAASIFADDAFEAYRAIALAPPLKTALRKKKTAMKRALAAYRKTDSYAVQQFSTLATYRMARIYQILSADLMASKRPANLDALALEQYELLLEEQAFPIEEKAIAVFEANARRTREGLYDEWIQRSFDQLAKLLPARYNKPEQGITFSPEIF